MAKHETNALTNEILRCARDAKYFIEKYVKVQHPGRGLLSFRPYNFQADLIDSFNKNRFNIINKGRQLGISTTIAAYCVWLMMFYREKNIVVVATKIQTAKNIITKVKTALRYMPKEIMLAKVVTDNKFSVELSHGSKIQALSTAKDVGRSEAASLLIVDEAAHVEDFERVYTSILPTISEGGKCIIASTPNGTGNHFYTLFVGAQGGQNNFTSVTLPWNVHPHHDQKWFENETRNMSRKLIAQEYEAEFIASGGTFLEPTVLDYLRLSIKEPIDKQAYDRNFWIWEHPEKGETYIIGADIARGDGQDFSTLQCIKTSTCEIVAEYKGKMPPEIFGEFLNNVGLMYNAATLAPENNKYDTCIFRLRELNYPNLYIEGKRKSAGAETSLAALMVDSNIPGFEVSQKTRPLILQKMEEMIRTKELKVYSSRLYEEAKTFVWKNRKPEAEKNRNDDLILSLAITCWLYESSFALSSRNRDMTLALINGMELSNTQYSSGQPLDPAQQMFRYNLMRPSNSSVFNRSTQVSENEVDLSWLISRG